MRAAGWPVGHPGEHPARVVDEHVLGPLSEDVEQSQRRQRAGAVGLSGPRGCGRRLPADGGDRGRVIDPSCPSPAGRVPAVHRRPATALRGAMSPPASTIVRRRGVCAAHSGAVGSGVKPATFPTVIFPANASVWACTCSAQCLIPSSPAAITWRVGAGPVAGAADHRRIPQIPAGFRQASVVQLADGTRSRSSRLSPEACPTPRSAPPCTCRGRDRQDPCRPAADQARRRRPYPPGDRRLRGRAGRPLSPRGDR